MHAERRWLFISYRKQQHFIFLAGATTVCFCGEEILFLAENKGSFFAVACRAASAPYSAHTQPLPSEVPSPHRASIFPHLL